MNGCEQRWRDWNLFCLVHIGLELKSSGRALNFWCFVPWAFISAQTFFLLKYWHEDPSSAELSLLDFHLWRLKPTEMTQHSSGIQVSGKCKGITCLFYFSFSAEPQAPNVTGRKIQMCVDSRDREIPSQSFGLVFPCIILLAELGWQQHRPGPGWKEALLEHLLKPSLKNLEN